LFRLPPEEGPLDDGRCESADFPRGVEGDCPDMGHEEMSKIDVDVVFDDFKSVFKIL
jgi:hypothetical protein